MIEKRKIRALLLFLAACAVFVCFACLVRLCWVAPIGPKGSEVGFAELNGAVRDAIGTNGFCKKASDLLGDLSLGIVCLFGAFGFVQLLQRKNLLKVDHDILILGVTYLVTLGCYVLFEVFPVNFRPVLEDGALAASFPSSHTVLFLVVLLTAAMQARKRIEKKPLRVALITVCLVLAGIGVVLRLLSGIHWITDIVGGFLLTGVLIDLYLTAGVLFDVEVR